MIIIKFIKKNKNNIQLYCSVIYNTVQMLYLLYKQILILWTNINFPKHNVTEKKQPQQSLQKKCGRFFKKLSKTC